MEFKLNDGIIQEIEDLFASDKKEELLNYLSNYHFADIAEIMERLDIEEARYVFELFDYEKASKILTELDEDTREEIFEKLTPKEIAKRIEELDTDEAVDIVADLSNAIKNNVIAEIEDVEHAKDIVDLLRYDEDSAGGLMAKELLRVNENWSVLTCVKQLRMQAKEVSRVHSIYVVDDENYLKGRLSLKDLLTTSTRTPIKDFYIQKLDFVRVDTPDSDVSRIMQKYDLEAIPVVDELGRLVGRITIDDIVDVIQEDADKDFQLATGLTQDVEDDDTILEHTKARLPWLILGLFGGFAAVIVAQNYESAMAKYGVLFFFSPLIAAMAGNVGVQSSAIIVQALAKNNLSGSLASRLIKEIILSLINGFVLAGLLLIVVYFFLDIEYIVGVTVAVSLILVIISASLVGTTIPMLLNKYKINPAMATGPFITTSNDVFGLLLYFMIAKYFIGF